MNCIVCGSAFGTRDYIALAQHFYDMAEKSDAKHVMWLNRNISKKKIAPSEIAELLKKYPNLGGSNAA